MKTKILTRLLVAAALAVAPGVALAEGGFHGGGFHGGFANHGFVSDRSFNFGRGFRHDHGRFLDHHFVIGNPWPGYYDQYYLGSYDYDYPYEDYSAQDYSDVMPAESVSLAVQRALAQLGYYHGPVDGV